MTEAETKIVDDKPADKPADEPADKPVDVAAAADKPDDKPADAAPAPDWKDKRLAQTIARNKGLIKQGEIKDAEIARLKALAEGKPTTTVVDAPGLTEADVDKRAAAKAAALNATDQFNSMCNSIAASGRLLHPDFDSKINDMVVKVIGNDDPAMAQAYYNLISAANETEKAHEILYALASDPNEAARVLALPPLKMAVEVARMVDATGQVITKTPKPIRPVGNRGAGHEQIKASDPDRADNLSTDEWMRRRDAEVAASRATRH